MQNSSGKAIKYDSTVRRIFPPLYERIKCLQQYTRKRHVIYFLTANRYSVNLQNTFLSGPFCISKNIDML